jgi:hypothetical protein
MAPHVTVWFTHQSDFAAWKMSLRATKYLQAVPDVNIYSKCISLTSSGSGTGQKSRGLAE